MNMRRDRQVRANFVSPEYKRAEFSAKMKRDEYTIIAPQMSPIHFDILRPVFKKSRYNVVILDNDNRSAILLLIPSPRIRLSRCAKE